jgi:hypothetical protein
MKKPENLTADFLVVARKNVRGHVLTRKIADLLDNFSLLNCPKYSKLKNRKNKSV